MIMKRNGFEKKGKKVMHDNLEDDKKEQLGKMIKKDR